MGGCVRVNGPLKKSRLEMDECIGVLRPFNMAWVRVGLMYWFLRSCSSLVPVHCFSITFNSDRSELV